MPQTSRGRTQDRKRVASGQEHEVRYQAKSRSTTGTAVKKAVKKVGNSRAKVDAGLAFSDAKRRRRRACQTRSR